MNDRALFGLEGRRVWVTGHRGMVGSALIRRLEKEACEIVTVSRQHVDLRRQAETEEWIDTARPDVVFLAAAKVGGILANDTYPADFLYDNLMIEANIIRASARAGVEKLLFLGSSCIYPKHAKQPMDEEQLLTGPLEPTNEWYAIAKIAGIKLCQAHRKQFGCDFISAMPTNLYGPRDNFDLQNSHVIPALVVKAHHAKLIRAPSIEVWGTGNPRREFMHVDDLADAMVYLACNYSSESHINVGSGSDVSISELARIVCDVVGFAGELEFDTQRPDGTPRKLMDSSLMEGLGWTPKIGLRDGLAATYEWFLQAGDQLRNAANA